MKLWLLIAWTGLAWAAVLMMGCATVSQDSLGRFTGRIEKVCTGHICYLRFDAELVNRRCTRGKLVWDDGSKFDQADASKWARCCTVLKPPPKRYQMWVTTGQEECFAHENSHIEVYESDGYIMVSEHHKKLHDFGLGRQKKRL